LIFISPIKNRHFCICRFLLSHLGSLKDLKQLLEKSKTTGSNCGSQIYKKKILQKIHSLKSRDLSYARAKNCWDKYPTVLIAYCLPQLSAATTVIANMHGRSRRHRLGRQQGGCLVRCRSASFRAHSPGWDESRACRNA